MRVRGLPQVGAAAGLACLAIAAAGPAHADDLNMTTCSDQQIMSSIQQNDPVIWWRINRDPKLEQELRENSWLVLPATAEQIFDIPWDEKWLAISKAFGIDIWQVAPQAGHA